MMNDTEDYSEAFLEIGFKGDLTLERASRGAAAIMLMTTTNPTTKITVTLGGFDNDPRELWDIEEAAAFFGLVARMLVMSGRKLDDYNFTDDTIACFAMCVGAGKIIERYESSYKIEINP